MMQIIFKEKFDGRMVYLGDGDCRALNKKKVANNCNKNNLATNGRKRWPHDKVKK